MALKPVIQWKHPLIRFAGLLLFSPLAVLYGVIIFFRNFSYHRKWRVIRRFQTHLVGIGGLTVGGSGKTPLVEFLAIEMFKRGKKTAVVSHGYRRKKKGLVFISDGRRLLESVEAAGDEAFMLSVNFLQAGCAIPVVACDDREEAILFLEQRERPDSIVLDNSFQDKAIGKKVNLIVIDYRESKYPNWPLPVGRYRDLPQEAMAADALIITKTPENGLKLHGWQTQLPVFYSSYTPAEWVNMFDFQRYPLETFSGKKLMAFAGLGFPESFVSVLEDLCRRFQMEMTGFKEFHDHAWYDEKQLKKISEKIPKEKENEYIIVTTQKDAVKIRPDWVKGRVPWLYLRSEFKLRLPNDIESKLGLS